MSAGADPIARIEGGQGALLDRLYQSLAEADGPPASRIDALRQARRAATAVEQTLRSEGYYGARVTAQALRVTPDDERFEAVVRVEPGEAYVFAPASLVYVDQAPPDAVQALAGDALALEPGAPARAETVLAVERAVLAALEQAGYPEARAEPREAVVDHRTKTLTVAYYIDAGRPAVLGPVVNVGPGRARADYLARITPFAVGDDYDRSLLGELAERLSSSGAYRSVSVGLAPSDPTGEGVETRLVEVRVDDTPRRSISAGASFSTSEGPGAEAEWQKRNLAGRGDILTVQARLATIERAVTGLFDRPHFLTPERLLSLSGRAGQDDTDAFERIGVDFGAAINQPVFDRWRVSAGGEVGFGRLSDALGEQTQVTGALPAAAIYDSRDNALNPTRGARLSLSAGPAVTLGDLTTLFAQVSAEGRTYHAIGDRWVLAGRARVGTLLGAEAEEVPADARFFAGGGGSVRGFDFQGLSPLTDDGALLGGRSLIEVSGEVRARVRGPLGVVGFVDAGAAGLALRPEFEDLDLGAGFGLRWHTDFGPLRADLGFPLTGREGQPPIQIYLSIGQAF
ncbi:MAG: autotransporter assembly complex family protein [Maricaulaceae bacterium]